MLARGSSPNSCGAIQCGRGLLPLEAKISDPQAGCVVTDDALDILREAVCGLGVDIEGQRQLGAADAIQLAQDGLGDVANLGRGVLVTDVGAEPDKPP